jgi:Fe2+ transport system protein FeoA
MADESRLHLTRFVRRLVGREANVQWTGARPLSTLRAGESGTVVSVDARQEQLSVFGLIPGARVTLEQRQPAYVLRVGFTELSVERDVAERIVVETA